jgi:hypothetical protein
MAMMRQKAKRRNNLTSAAGGAAGAPQGGDITVRYGGGIASKVDVVIVLLWDTVRRRCDHREWAFKGEL